MKKRELFSPFGGPLLKTVAKMLRLVLQTRTEPVAMMRRSSRMVMVKILLEKRKRMVPQ